MCQRSAVTTAASDWRALVFAFVSSHSHSHTCSGRSEIPKMSANNDGVEATALCRRALGLLTLYNKGGRHDWTDSLVFARPLTTRPVASHQHAGYRLRFGRLSQSTPYSASPHESRPEGALDTLAPTNHSITAAGRSRIWSRVSLPGSQFCERASFGSSLTIVRHKKVHLQTSSLGADTSRLVGKRSCSDRAPLIMRY